MSKAYDAVRFLIKENPHRFVMSKIDPKDFVDNPSLQHLLEKEIDKYHFRHNFIITHGSYTVQVNKFSEVVFTRYKQQLYGTYTLLGLLYLYTGLNALEQWHFFHFLFLMLMLCFLPFANYFIYLP